MHIHNLYHELIGKNSTFSRFRCEITTQESVKSEIYKLFDYYTGNLTNADLPFDY